MHEYAICLNLVSQLEDLARQHRATAVSRVTVKIGVLSGVERPLLERAFPLVIPKTVAAGAELVTESVPLKVRCPSCALESEVNVNDLSCPECGEWRTEVIAGREMILATVEFNVEEPTHV